jgi:predicted double-glycine peptidase
MKPHFRSWLLIILLGFSFPLCALQVEVPTNLNTESYSQNIAKFYGITSTKNLKILKIIGYQQTLDWTCGPAAVMSLLYYYGKLPAKELNQVTELRIAKEMGTSVKIGTSAHQIIRYLNKHGFKAKLKYHGTLSQLQANLKRNSNIS